MIEELAFFGGLVILTAVLWLILAYDTIEKMAKGEEVSDDQFLAVTLPVLYVAVAYSVLKELIPFKIGEEK